MKILYNIEYGFDCVKKVLFIFKYNSDIAMF